MRNFELSKKPTIYIVAMIMLIVSACQSPKEKVQIKINRFEQSLFSIPIDSIAASVPRLQQQYGELFDLYNLGVIRIGAFDDPQYPARLTEFLTDSYMHGAYRKVSEKYPDVMDLETDLSKAFSAYRKEFPERRIPSVYTLISGFNQSMITADTILAIALDKYLGPEEETYSLLGLANYQRHVMDRKYIVPDCMRAWICTEFQYNDSIDNALTNILYEGKIMYAVRRMLPDVPDSLMFGYTPQQVQWCENNTGQMWAFLVEKKMLYATDYMTINKLIAPAPFCSLFTRESPGRAAIWLGYQIIFSYMNHNNVSLEALLSDDDYQDILAKAKFKP